MKKTALFALFIFMGFTAIAQNEWKKAEGLVMSEGETICTMHFPSKEVGYLGCGDYISLYKTIDGGEHWDYLSIDTSPRPINSIYFTSKDTGFVGSWDYIGNSFQKTSYIYRTTDGGRSWNKTNLESSSKINCFYFHNALEGFAGGSLPGNWFPNYIYRTSDGGKSWSECRTIKKSDTMDITGIGFVDETTGYAVGGYRTNDGPYAFRLKTTDNGTIWYEDGTDIKGYFTAITFVNGTTGFITADSIPDEQDHKKPLGSAVLKTTDGGTSWTRLDFPGIDIRSIHFTDEQTGYFTTNSSGIYKTTDGGENWIFEEIAPNIKSSYVYFSDHETGHVAAISDGVYRKGPENPEPPAGSLEVSPTTLKFGHAGGSQKITVTTDRQEWQVGPEIPEWLSVEKSDDGFTVTALQNPLKHLWRSKTLIITAGTGEDAVKKAVKITQDAYSRPTLAISNTEPHFPGYGGSMEITVLTNAADFWFDEYPDWITIVKKENGFTLTAEPNPDAKEKRSCFFFIYAGRDINDEELNMFPIVVTQEKGWNVAIDGATDAFARRVFPNPARDVVSLPCGNNGELTIYNAAGVLVERIKVAEGESRMTVNVSGYPSGMYFYTCDGISDRFTVE